MPDESGPEDRPDDPSAAPAGAVMISVCVSCRAGIDGADRPGQRLLERLRIELGPASPVKVRAVQCMSVCNRVCTASLSAPGRYTYVFGDIDPESGAQSLLDGAAIFAAQDYGYMLWRERPEALRRGIVARIPPVSWHPDDGAHPR